MYIRLSDIVKENHRVAPEIKSTLEHYGPSPCRRFFQVSQVIFTVCFLDVTLVFFNCLFCYCCIFHVSNMKRFITLLQVKQKRRQKCVLPLFDKQQENGAHSSSKKVCRLLATSDESLLLLLFLFALMTAFVFIFDSFSMSELLHYASFFRCLKYDTRLTFVFFVTVKCQPFCTSVL